MANRIVHVITPSGTLINHWNRARDTRKQLKSDIKTYFSRVNMPETYKLHINTMGTYVPDIIAVVYDTQDTEVGQVVAGGNTFNSYSQVKGKVKYIVSQVHSVGYNRGLCTGINQVNDNLCDKVAIVEINDDRYAVQVIADNFKPTKNSNKANVRVIPASRLNSGKQAINEDIQELIQKMKFYEQILGIHINREVIEESVTNS